MISKDNQNKKIEIFKISIKKLKVKKKMKES